MQLDRRESLPQELLALEPRDIKRVYPNPTLVTLQGRRAEPLFVSVLLHGNETTGFAVLKDLTRRYADAIPPRSLMVFVGNVDAAAANVRRLHEQKDFNRIWAGGHGPYFDLAQQVIDAARVAQPFASIDVHNNTGTNPFYGCVNTLHSANLNLAALFARIAVYYRNPPTTQSMAFAQFCPAVTVECGQVGNAAGTERAIEFVNDVLHLEHLPQRPPPQSDLTVFETVGRILIDPDCSFGFADDGAELVLADDLERHNFGAVPPEFVWGRSQRRPLPLRVLDEDNSDLTERFFVADGDAIRLRRTMTPAMLTHRLDIVRQDCLGYLMTPRSFTD